MNESIGSNADEGRTYSIGRWGPLVAGALAGTVGVQG